MKNKIYKLYQMCGKLNLYFKLCETKKERVLRELTSIEKLVKELLEEVGNY